MDQSVGTNSGLLHQLRAATADLHRKIEDDLDLLNPSLTEARYRCVLERFFGFYEPVESALSDLTGWSAFNFNWSERRKTGHLQRDLHDLGHTEGSLARLPRCGELPRLEQFAQGIGTLYVMEGACLGGQAVLRYVRPRLGLSTLWGCAFFATAGSDVPRRWASFRQFLSRYEQAGCSADVVADAACDTFRRLNRWLQSGKGQAVDGPITDA